MKRWITAGLALLLALSVAGCAGGMTPEERFEAVMLQNAEMPSMECDAQTRVKMAYGGNGLDMAMDTDIKIGRDGDRIEMAVKNSSSIMDRTMDDEFYYRDGYLYTSMMGQSFRMPLDAEMMLEQIKAQNLQTFAISDLDNLKMERDGKNVAFDYSVRPGRLNSYIDRAMSLIGSGLFPIGSLRVTAVSGRLVADQDNHVKSHLTRMSMLVDLGKEPMKIAVEMKYHYQNVGGTVTIEFPADLESYTPIG